MRRSTSTTATSAPPRSSASLSRGLRVKPGKHVVTVVRPGYGTKTVDVESKPGAAIDVVVELEK